MAREPDLRVRFEGNDAIPSVEAINQGREPFEDLYHLVLAQPWWQFFLLVGAAWFGLATIYASLYWLADGAISNTKSFEDCFYFSVQTLSTIGYGVMAPANRVGHLLVTFEALTGTLVIALVTGGTFAKFARPTAKVLFAARPVISPRNGVPHLMVRVANWRHNQVVDAQLRLVIVVPEVTREGDVMRRPIVLPLVRDTTPYFRLTWTAMHTIDADSPLYGDGLARLVAERTEMFASITAFDVTISQTVHAQHRYQLADVVSNARFADVLVTRDDGHRVIDYAKFHQVVLLPDDPAASEAAPAA